MTLLDIAKGRSGTLRDGYSVQKAGVTESRTRVEYGTAVGASSDGYVTILMDGAPTDDADYDQSAYTFAVPCDSPIASGDRVAYISGAGRGKAVSVANLSEIASEAQAVADATNQHFWDDANGAHVTEVEQEAWSDSSSPDYHTGRDILLNSQGILLRDDYAPLASFTPSAVAFYDGEGSAASNVTATFGKDGAVVGPEGSWQTSMTADGFGIQRNGIVAASVSASEELSGWVSDELHVVWDQDISGSTWYSVVPTYPGEIPFPSVCYWLFEAPVGLLYSFIIPNTEAAGNAYNSGEVRLSADEGDIGAATMPVTVTGGGYTFTATAQLDNLAEFHIEGGSIFARTVAGTSDGAAGGKLTIAGGLVIDTGEESLRIDALSSQKSPSILVTAADIEVYADALTLDAPLGIASGGTGQTGVETVTTIAQVITAASGNTISSVSYRQWGKVVSLFVQFTRSSAIAANARVDVGTIVSGKRPVVLVGGGNANFQCHANSNGVIQARNVTGASYAANTAIGIGFTYLLA